MIDGNMPLQISESLHHAFLCETFTQVEVPVRCDEVVFLEQKFKLLIISGLL